MENTNKLEILVVEDGPENLAAARKYFSGIENVSVDYAVDYKQALRLMNEKDYAAAIFDRNMPENDKSTEVKPYGDLLMEEANKKAVPSLMMTAAFHGNNEFAFIIYEVGFSGDRTESKRNTESWKSAYEILRKCPLEMISRAKSRHRTVLGKNMA